VKHPCLTGRVKTPFGIVANFILFILPYLLISSPLKAGVEANQPPPIAVIVESSSPDGMSLDVLDVNTMAPRHLLVPDSAMQARLKVLNLQKGDHATITEVTDKDGHGGLQLINVQTVPLLLRERLFALLCCSVDSVLR
jgi:hypothetical protein